MFGRRGYKEDDNSDSDSDNENEIAKTQRYFKVLFVGCEGTGAKTSFITKYTGTKGTPAYKELLVGDKNVILELWDNPSSAVRDADGIVIGYDITSRSSYNMALNYCRVLLEQNPRALKMVIGNKADLKDKRQVSTAECFILGDYAQAEDYYEVSALTGDQVDTAMLSFTRTLLRLSTNIQYSTYLPIKEYMDDFAMRIVFIGAEKSGTKTSFINRYMTGAFSERQGRNYDAPQKKKLFLNGATINLELVDMPNVKHLGGLKLVSGIVIGYSSASRQSFGSAQGIYRNVKGMFPKAVTMVLGGAADKASSTGEGVSAEEGRSFAKSIGANLFFEVSSKTGARVEESMDALIREVLKTRTKIKDIDLSDVGPSTSQDFAGKLSSAKEGRTFLDGSKPWKWSVESALSSSYTPDFKNPHVPLRIMFIGYSSTGTKDSFILRYSRDTFIEDGTSGQSMFIDAVTIDGTKRDVIYTKCDQKTYPNPALRTNCIGFVIGYDITNRDSFVYARDTFATLWQDCPFAPIMVVGNKTDLREMRAVTPEEGKALARNIHASLFFEVSAKTGYGVHESMKALFGIINDRAKALRERTSPSPQQSQPSQQQQQQQSTSFFSSLFRKGKQKQKQEPEPKPREQPDPDQEVSMKIVFIGSQSIGAKTSFIIRYIKSTFNEMTSPTIGAGFFTKKVIVRNRKVKVDIWDTAGNERYISLTPMYIRGADGVVLGYDITDDYSLRILRDFYRCAWGVNPEITFMVIGNKKDLEEQRKVTQEDGLAFANEIGALFYESIYHKQ